MIVQRKIVQRAYYRRSISTREPRGLLGESSANRNLSREPSRLAWRIKSEYATMRLMSVRSCRVTIQDLDGTSHIAEVTASSLYEAVAQGLAALRKNEWVEGIQERFGIVKVSVAEVRVEHQVKIADFTKWLERPGRTPREITQRQKIRAILGMSTSR
jgi:hypothetical protein